jgi:hypothetical protein
MDPLSKSIGDYRITERYSSEPVPATTRVNLSTSHEEVFDHTYAEVSEPPSSSVQAKDVEFVLFMIHMVAWATFESDSPDCTYKRWSRRITAYVTSLGPSETASVIL